MKKTLLLLVAFMATMFSAQAQTEMLTEGVITEFESYFDDANWASEAESTATFDGEATAFHLRGDYNAWSDNPANGITFYTTENENVLQAKAESFTTGQWGFKVCKGNGWLDDNEWGLVEAGSYAELGKEAALKLKGENIYVGGVNNNISLVNAVFTVTLTDGKPSSLKVEGVVEKETFYLPGTCTGWDFNSANKFKPVAEGVYELKLAEFFSDFKVVKDANWANQWGGAGNNMQAGETYELKAGGDNTGFAPGVVLKNVVVTLYVDGDKVSIKFDGDQKVEHSYGLVGQFQGWNTATASFFTEMEDGTWTLEMMEFGGGTDNQFKISIDKSWNCFSPKGNASEAFVSGVPYVCDRGDKNGVNFYLGENGKKYDVHFTLVPEKDEVTATFNDETGVSHTVVLSGNATIYDLQGRKVEKPVHGIYIQNGRKFVVK